MATFTTRLGLRKPAGTEQSNVVTDLNENYDKIDDAVGTTVCTSTTRPASPFTGQTIFETDTNHFLVYSGTQWIHQSIPYVLDNSEIVAPYDGQIIFNGVDDMLHKYRSGSWVAFAATGETNHEARYAQTVGTSVGNASDTWIAFDESIYTTTDVTRQASNTEFVLNRSGLWEIAASIRLPAATNGERHLWIDHYFGSGRLAGATTETSLTASLNCATVYRFNAGAAIRIGCWQVSGAARTTDPAFEYTNVNLTWLRP